MNKIFVNHRNEAAANGNEAVSGTEGCGFKQMDVVHLFGLVCPDFPEDLIARVCALSQPKDECAPQRRRLCEQEAGANPWSASSFS